LIIKGRAFVNEQLLDVTIHATAEGFVERIEMGILAREGEVLDFVKPGYVIMPGFIDVHVHLRDWKQSYKEDVRSGTYAAAAGGIVLVGDMPNTDPPVDTLARIVERERTLASKSVVDFVFYTKPCRNLEETLEGLKISSGVKVYPEDWHRFKSLASPKKGARFKRELVIFHPEDPACLQLYSRHSGARGYGDDRPQECEVSAVEGILKSYASLGFRVHLTHVSTRRSLEAVLTAKAGKNTTVTVDVTPHHLLLDKSAYEALGSKAKVYPPLRGRDDREYLQEAFAKGVIDLVASDHAPHAIEEKALDYERAPPGFSGVETLVPSIFTLAVARGVPLSYFVRVLSRNPARLLGLDRYLGEIRPGALASFTVIDTKQWRRVRSDVLYSKSKFTPFEGWEFRGWPVATIVRSNLVFFDGEVYDSGFRGKNLRGLQAKS